VRPHALTHPARHPSTWPVRGSAKHLWATTGVSTHRQEHGTRQLPLWPVVGSSRCLRLASAPPWERLPPTTDPLTTALLSTAWAARPIRAGRAAPSGWRRQLCARPMPFATRTKKKKKKQTTALLRRRGPPGALEPGARPNRGGGGGCARALAVYKKKSLAQP
jgi:hypothetical protein